MEKADKKASHVREAAADLVNESRKLGQEFYEEGVHKVHQAEEQIKVYSDDLLKKVQENPLRSVLIAGGVGFLLAALLRK